MNTILLFTVFFLSAHDGKVDAANPPEFITEIINRENPGSLYVQNIYLALQAREGSPEEKIRWLAMVAYIFQDKIDKKFDIEKKPVSLGGESIDSPDLPEEVRALAKPEYYQYYQAQSRHFDFYIEIISRIDMEIEYHSIDRKKAISIMRSAGLFGRFGKSRFMKYWINKYKE